jgi:DNA replication licensing factor MCM5
VHCACLLARSMDFDADRITYTRQNLGNGDAGGGGGGNEFGEGGGLTRSEARKQFREFIRNFRVGTLFPYRSQLLQRFRKREPWLEVQLNHVGAYDSSETKGMLLQLLQEQPDEHLPLFELAAKDALKNLVGQSQELTSFPSIQIVLKSDENPTGLRLIAADHVSKLLKVSACVR